MELLKEVVDDGNPSGDDGHTVGPSIVGGHCFTEVLPCGLAATACDEGVQIQRARHIPLLGSRFVLSLWKGTAEPASQALWTEAS